MYGCVCMRCTRVSHDACGVVFLISYVCTFLFFCICLPFCVRACICLCVCITCVHVACTCAVYKYFLRVPVSFYLCVLGCVG